jgi:hypothetical protein
LRLRDNHADKLLPFPLVCFLISITAGSQVQDPRTFAAAR